MRRALLSSLALTAAMSGFMVHCSSDGTNASERPATDGEGDPDASSQDADGTTTEGGPCNDADPTCSAHLFTCAEVDWCLATTPATAFDVLRSVWGTGNSDVWAVGSGGTILHYDGNEWNETPSGVQNTFNAVWGSGVGDVYTASTNQAMFHATGFHGEGTTWTPVPTASDDPSTVAQMNAIWGTSADDVRVAGGFFYFHAPDGSGYPEGNEFTKTTDADGGIAWTPVAGQGEVLSVWGAASDDVWMTADNSNDEAFRTAVTLHGTPGEGGQMVFSEVDSQGSGILYSVYGSSANDVWAVGTLGAIRHITQTDVRWQVVASPTTATLHAVWAAGPNDVWAVGDKGTILHYDGTAFTTMNAEFPAGGNPPLYAIWGAAADDIWIAGEAIMLHYTGPKTEGGRP